MRKSQKVILVIMGAAALAGCNDKAKDEAAAAQAQKRAWGTQSSTISPDSWSGGSGGGVSSDRTSDYTSRGSYPYWLYLNNGGGYNQSQSMPQAAQVVPHPGAGPMPAVDAPARGGFGSTSHGFATGGG